MNMTVRTIIRPYEHHDGIDNSGLLNDPSGRWWPDSDTSEHSGEFTITDITRIVTLNQYVITGAASTPWPTETEIPDFVWIKNRSTPASENTSDRVIIHFNTGVLIPTGFISNQECLFFRIGPGNTITSNPNVWTVMTTDVAERTSMDACLVYI